MNLERNIIISLDDLTYAIPTTDGGKTILQDIDLQLYEYEWLAIIGSNGSGKSTLAKVISRLYQTPDGAVTFTSAVKPSVGLVMQNPDTQMIGETVYEDVCIGLTNKGIDSEHMEKRAVEALRKVGLDTLRDFPAVRLSGGQKQLLAIAGCIAANPSVIVFDEATSMLDPMSRSRIVQIAQELHRAGTTIVWITQILDELSCCERVVALEQGKLAFEGSKHDFFYRKDGLPSACEQLGFLPPYTVQVAHHLLKRGCKLDPLPISPADLGKAAGTLLC